MKKSKFIEKTIQFIIIVFILGVLCYSHYKMGVKVGSSYVKEINIKK
jgi:hypothetical protein